jgi:hypothetical protein
LKFNGAPLPPKQTWREIYNTLSAGLKFAVLVLGFVGRFHFLELNISSNFLFVFVL